MQSMYINMISFLIKPNLSLSSQNTVSKLVTILTKSYFSICEPYTNYLKCLKRDYAIRPNELHEARPLPYILLVEKSSLKKQAPKK